MRVGFLVELCSNELDVVALLLEGANDEA